MSKQATARATKPHHAGATDDPIDALQQFLPLDLCIAIMRAAAEEMLATDGDEPALSLSSAELHAIETDGRRTTATTRERKALRRFMKSLARGTTQPLRALGKPAAGLVRDQAIELRNTVVSGWVETLWGALREHDAHHFLLTRNLLPFAAPEVFRELTAGLNALHHCEIATWMEYATLNATQCAPQEACEWCLRVFTELLRKRVDQGIVASNVTIIPLADDASLHFTRCNAADTPYRVLLS